MRLVYIEGPNKGQEVKVGDIVVKDNCSLKVVYFRKPTSPASSGKVTVRDGKARHEQEFYVSIIGAEWIEREDRTPMELFGGNIDAMFTNPGKPERK